MLFIARHECGTNAAHAAAARRGCKPLVCCERADDDALDAAVICRTCVPVEQYRGELGCGVWRRRRSRPSSHNGAVCCLQPRPLQPPLRNGQNPRFLRNTATWQTPFNETCPHAKRNFLPAPHFDPYRIDTHTHITPRAHISSSPQIVRSPARPPSSVLLFPPSRVPQAAGSGGLYFLYIQ